MKMTFLIDGMIYVGSALMLYNIISYVRFAQTIRESGNWEKERAVLNVPIILLVAFLCGYLAVGLFGHPDLVTGGILLGGSIFVAVMLWLIRRVAGRIRENEHLEAALSAAEEASRAKTFFLSNMSHDLRTPLNAIIGYTALARKEGLETEEIQSFLVKIERSGQQLLEIVNDVLEMSRIESGKLELSPEAVDLEATAAQARDVILVQMEEKNIRFAVECDVTDRWVLCDRRCLDRILLNLLSNANKFTPEGGSVWLLIRQTGRTDTTGAYEIRVKDNGIGMSAEFAGRLFVPFEREKTSTISQIQGTGLGMSITKRLVDRMGGTIEVDTEQGKGTEFVITLKLQVLGEQPGTDQEKQRSCAGPDSAVIAAQSCFSGKKLLLAEDNPINQEIASLILQEAGFDVEIAENGQKAVQMLEEAEAGTYAAVLMDIQMPVMDGYEAARHIRSMADPGKAHIPIIAVTANAFREDREAALQAGMQDHIAKPYEQDLMIRTIASVLKTYAG